jgi:hypothetical protein
MEYSKSRGRHHHQHIEASAHESDEAHLPPVAFLHETTMYLGANDDAIIRNDGLKTIKKKNDSKCVESDNDYFRLGRQRFGDMYPWLVAFSVLVYWTFVSLIPVYNKYLFQHSIFPYPIATAAIQLGTVSFLCAVVNIVQRRVCFSEDCDEGEKKNCMRTIDTTDFSAPTIGNSTERSWILGPHFWWKLKWCFPIGVLFGVKYSVSNLGLHLVSTQTHLLLQSTDLVWAVLGAWSINGERSSMAEIVCLIGCIAGSVLLSWQLLFDESIDASSSEKSYFAVVVNLTSPILLGLCLATLRLACTELMRPDNRVGGTVSAIELTSIKLIISSMICLVMACFIERGAKDEVNGILLDPWWVAFIGLPTSTRSGVVCGAFLVSVFQVNCTFLTFLTSAVALGIVGQVKIIPQWVVASMFGVGANSRPTGVISFLGAILIMSSAAGFALSNLMTTSKLENACQESLLVQNDCEKDKKRNTGTRTEIRDERTALLT